MMKRNFLSKLFQASLMCCLTVLFTACDDMFATEDNPTPAYLSMSTSDVTLKVGESKTRTAIAVSSAVIEYTSDNTAIATVDANGTVTGVAEGETKINAIATGYSTSGKKIFETAKVSYKVKVTHNPVVNLSALTADYEAQDGDILTGVLGTNVKITIAAPVAPATTTTVTLIDANINGSDTWTTSKYAGLTALGNATIILKDGSTNTVKGFHEDFPGIYVPSGSTLIIKGENAGTGSLTASSVGGCYGAGIGGGYTTNNGNIEILGGTINASGNNGSAIGSGTEATGGNIEILGGTINASGNYGSAIGAGCGTTGGNINIQGGTVNATCQSSAAIGAGGLATCGNITISGGTIVAVGGSQSAGIGASYAYGQSRSSICGNIEITGGDVTASGDIGGAGIGTGLSGDGGTILSQCGNITITSGVTQVTATKGLGSPCSIGKGGYSGILYGVCGTVTIGAVVGEIATSPYTYTPAP